MLHGPGADRGGEDRKADEEVVQGAQAAGQLHQRLCGAAGRPRR